MTALAPAAPPAGALRRWLPPVLHAALGRASGRAMRFSAAPQDWTAASALCPGYAEQAILERVLTATRAVVSGQAAFERDAVLFDHWTAPFQLLAPLLRHALQHGGRLEVVDFGGSLGSTYRQCRPFLPAGMPVRWRVVEQPGFVAAGAREFTTPELSFHLDLAALPPAEAPRLLLLSSVLQYLPDPAAMLGQWQALGAASLVIDRTPLADADADRLCIQHVPRHIYAASYPMWVLSQPRLLQRLGAAGWSAVCAFDCPEGWHRVPGELAFSFRGMVLEQAAP